MALAKYMPTRSPLISDRKSRSSFTIILMKPYFSIVLSLVICSVYSSPISNTSKTKKETKVLVFTKTGPYYHESIPSGISALSKLGNANGFIVDATNDSLIFNSRNLKAYAAVVFLSTTGDILTDEQKDAFTKYIQSGKGFVGIHAAADTEYGWSWYNRLIGGHFMSHPIEQNATLHVVDRKFIATKHLPEYWNRFDEWYSFQRTHWKDVHVLITIDEKSYTGGEHGRFHPMSWYRLFDGGRSFYTQLSHRDESYVDENFVKHIWGGLQYAMFGKTS